MTADRTPSTGSAHRTEVRVLGPDDVRVGARLLARGFAEDPGLVTLLPDPDVRRTLIEIQARSVLHGTLPHGTVNAALVDDEPAAIAVWHAPGARSHALGGAARTVAGGLTNVQVLVRAAPHATSVLSRTIPRSLPFGRARRRALAEASAGTAWHLAFLATAPEHRGRGLARTLLDRQLERCDQDGVAAWLETTDPANPPIYARFGFTTVVHVEDAAWLPGYWVMRREPVGADRG